MKLSIRSCAVGFGLTIGSLVICLVLIEAGIRCYQSVSKGISAFDGNATMVYLDGQASAKGTSIVDSSLGWRPTPYFRFSGKERNADESEHTLNLTQESRGFRKFGDPAAPRPRIFVIGDSYTQSVEVSDEKTYYSLLGKKMDTEIFAIGARGYGTLQEYLLLDQFFSEIKPDLVVWQFCYNDFMGNYQPLEMAWRAGSIGLERPYLEGDKISSSIPKPYAWLLRLNSGVLRAVPFVTTLVDRWLFRIKDNNKDTLLEQILTLETKHGDFARSVEVTGQLFDRIRNRINSTPVVLFEACTTAPTFHSTVGTLARNRDFYFVSDLPGVLDKARARGEMVDSYDRVHFNERGHELVADELEAYIRARNIL